jgi:hypothetical protein
VKQASGELFELIKGLNLSEKRYCSIYLARHAAGKENRYLQLFDYLSSATAYDTNLTRAYMGYAVKPGHYAVLKAQLFEQLLDALHQYDLFTNAEQQLLRGIHQCHLLMQKGLFAACARRIKSLWQTALQMGHYEAQLQLQQLKMQMKARNYYRHETDETLLQWKQETDTVLNQLEVTNRYRYLSSRVFKVQYESGARGKQQAEKMEAVTKLPEFTDKANAATNRALLDYLQVNALYNFTNLQTTEALAYNEQFLQLLDESPLLKQQQADRYFSVLNNYLIDCLVLKRYDTLEQGLVTLRSLRKEPAFKRLVNFEANVFRLGYLLEMNYLFTVKKYQQAYACIPDITTGLQKYGDRVVKHNRITLHYLMAYVCFMLNRYSEVLDHLNYILQEKETAVAQDVQVAARMMQLITHFELGDERLLDSLAKSVRRYMKADKEAEVQKAVISFILSSVQRVEITDTDWQKLVGRLNALSGDTKQSAGAGLFDYSSWVEGKYNKKREP